MGDHSLHNPPMFMLTLHTTFLLLFFSVIFCYSQWARGGFYFLFFILFLYLSTRPEMFVVLS